MVNEDIEQLCIERTTYIFFDEYQKLNKEGWILVERREIMVNNMPGFRYTFYRKKNETQCI